MTSHPSEFNGIIRLAAVPGDSQAVAVLSGQLGYPTTASAVTERLAKLLGDPHHAVWVAVLPGGEIAGWVHAVERWMVMVDPFVEIGGLVVDARLRGKGVGAQLMAAAEGWAQKRGIDRVRLRSNVARTEAHRFYERLGYERTKQQLVLDRKLG
jgi:GNAT superfamily N-acetyltransferase